MQTDYRYTGQRLDAGVGAPSPVTVNGVAVARGLYFYNSRYYDPVLGRFISPDTIVPEPGNPQALNRYAYVGNNPLRFSDPTGFFTEEEIMNYMGVDTWEEVLAMFEDGGQYAGAWGWLEVLRQAELEDTVSFWYYSADAYQTDMVGVFTEKDGDLVFQFEGGGEIPGIQLAAIGMDNLSSEIKRGDTCPK